MNATMARLLTRLYPRAWRERYGAEFESLLLDDSSGLRSGIYSVANVIGSALSEHIFPTQGGNVEQPAYSFGKILRNPSAFIPVAMSLTALALVLGRVAMSGTGPEVMVNGRPDEGATAHLFQLLMAGQLPVLAFFAIKWLPRAPVRTIGVLALQAGAVLAAIAPVMYFNL
jgi:hypothetical protein